MLGDLAEACAALDLILSNGLAYDKIRNRTPMGGLAYENALFCD